MRKKIVISVCLLLWITDGNAEFSSQNEELNQVRSDIDAVKKKMQQITLQENKLNDQLADIEYHYGETAALLRDIKKKVEQKHKKLNSIQQDKESYRNQITRLSKELSGHVKAAYAIGQQEKLKLILNQENPALSGRMMAYHGYWNKIRLQRLAEIKESVKRLNQLTEEQEKETELLESDLEQKKQEQNALDEFRVQRSRLLDRLADDFSSQEQQLNQLIESENKLEDLIGNLQAEEDKVPETSWTEVLTDPFDNREASSDGGELSTEEELPVAEVAFSSLKGKLPWPVKGRITTSTGSGQLESMRDGVLIDAGEGAEIRAVTAGKVVYSEWLRGYGLLMIIDHGNGYMTLYAFNQSLYKKVGDRVRTGDVIASVGQSGGRSRSGLYFGIRQNGKPVDPVQWCSKLSRDQTG
ncbi:murein hydrolase activator EnvC family protein [Methylosarcina fibrata]|uniref:murein hydrolase activator EnvC family protein n=1 Tax=Methylosarcina fibrata TaxID=105972 RepID=UPI00035E0EBE|nr:peptidoglycan DD-metalloendopeptidase family protein [Methylosarcina fibrata]